MATLAELPSCSLGPSGAAWWRLIRVYFSPSSLNADHVVSLLNKLDHEFSPTSGINKARAASAKNFLHAVLKDCCHWLLYIGILFCSLIQKTSIIWARLTSQAWGLKGYNDHLLVYNFKPFLSKLWYVLSWPGNAHLNTEGGSIGTVDLLVLTG